MFIKSKNKIFDKLVIVAHPDDELIFYGSKLIKDPLNKVICMTHSNSKRFVEFSNLMKQLGCGYIMLDHKDDMRIKNMHKLYKLFLYEYIKKNNRKIKKITTHNPFGEYGHNFHKAVSLVIIDICKQLNIMHKLYFFSIGKRKLRKSIIQQKYNLMATYYPSQYKVINKLGLTNYMLYESSVYHLKNTST